MFDTTWKDLRYAVRSLRRTPAFTMTALVTLALGIGANTAIFSLVNAVMLRTLPVAAPGELVFIGHRNPSGADTGVNLLSNPAWLQRIRQETGIFTGVAAYNIRDFKVVQDDAVEQVVGQYASGNYHSLIGVPMTYVAAQFAKTGFYDVPVLAKMLYKPSSPTRIVQPLFGTKPDDVYKVVGTKIKYDASTNLATLPVTESELTTVVQHAVANAPKETLPFPVRTIQVGLEKGAVEIFALSPQKNRDATVRVQFRPFVKGGELNAEVLEVTIGSLEVP